MKKYFAEMFGTLVLVLMGCGAAVFNGGAVSVGAVLTIAFAFGLAVLSMAYAIGSISGCHINPAITLGMYLSRRIGGKEAALYILFQVIGAIIGSALLYFIVKGFPATGTLTGANGWAPNVTVTTAFLAETIFTMIFVLVVLGATCRKAPCGFGGLAIGLSLVLIHIVCIPITGTSVNPARSIGPALFQGGEALSQLWLFIVAPLLGSVLAAGVWKLISVDKD